MAREFRKGGLVMLKSGGPTMTVMGHNSSGNVEVIWMSPGMDQKVGVAQFPEICLKSLEIKKVKRMDDRVLQTKVGRG
jgi:uncharacterized protein YodC (DUF2158 family)